MWVYCILCISNPWGIYFRSFNTILFKGGRQTSWMICYYTSIARKLLERLKMPTCLYHYLCIVWLWLNKLSVLSSNLLLQFNAGLLTPQCPGQLCCQGECDIKRCCVNVCEKNAKCLSVDLKTRKILYKCSPFTIYCFGCMTFNSSSISFVLHTGSSGNCSHSTTNISSIMLWRNYHNHERTPLIYSLWE